MNEVERTLIVRTRLGALRAMHRPKEISERAGIDASALAKLTSGRYQLRPDQALAIEAAFPEFGAAWLLGLDDACHLQNPIDASFN